MARTLAPRTGLLTLLRELRYTLAQLTAEPLAAPHVPAFEALREEWKTVLLEEVSILEAMATAQAAIDKADDDLDDFAGRADRAVEDFTGGNEKHPLREHLFKGKSLGRFRRPILKGQLEAMRGWVSPLAGAGSPELTALANELPALLAAADKAVEQLTAATQKNRQFRDVGTRRQFVDKLNAARKGTHGALAKLPFQLPNLPSDFEDRFFRTESAPADDGVETIDDVRDSIKEMEAELAQKKATLAQMEADEAAAAQAAADRKAKELALEEVEAQRDALAKQAAELRAQLGKK